MSDGKTSDTFEFVEHNDADIEIIYVESCMNGIMQVFVEMILSE